MQNYLKKEKSHGAILGPYKQNPFCCNIAVSPLNSVPKKETDERRVILDLSFPKGSSINDFVSKDFYLGDKVNLTYPGVDDLVEIIKRKGQGCLLFKRDLTRAYRLIVLDPGDVSLAGYSFNGEFYFDKVLSMGLRSAAHIAQRTTNSISFICNTSDISIVNYLDDFAGADTVEKARKSFVKLGNILCFCGLDESLHKAFGPSVEMCFVGVLFNTETLTLKITPKRLNKILSLLRLWLEKDQATLKELQSLLGKLNFVAHCVKPARIFICRLLNWLRKIHSSEGPQIIPLETKKDLLWWHNFLPLYNGVPMMDLQDWSNADQFLSCDSCLQGAGAWFDGKYFHCKFPSFILSQNLHINALELLTVVVALKLWGKFLSGRKIVINCNNSGWCSMLNRGAQSRCLP